MGSAQPIGCSTKEEGAPAWSPEEDIGACFDGLARCTNEQCCAGDLHAQKVENLPGATKALASLQLLHAARDGQLDGIRSLLAAGAFIETRRPFALTNDVGSKNNDQTEGLTPLMYAAQAGHTAACELLLRAGACANAEDEDGLRPLHFAAQCASKETCSLLIKHGAQRGARDCEGNLALDYLPGGEVWTSTLKANWHALLHPSVDERARLDGAVEDSDAVPEVEVEQTAALSLQQAPQGVRLFQANSPREEPRHPPMAGMDFAEGCDGSRQQTTPSFALELSTSCVEGPEADVDVPCNGTSELFKLSL